MDYYFPDLRNSDRETMKLILLPIAAILLAQSAQAQVKEPYALKSVQPSITLDQFNAIPAPENDTLAFEQGERKQFKLPPLKRKFFPQCNSAGALLKCQWMQADLPDGYPTQERTPFANGSGFLDFYFVDAPDGVKRLATISVWTNMVQFDNLIAAYRAKYGEPKTTTVPVQNGFGAKFDQQVFSWSDGENAIEMRTLCGSADRLCITYSNIKLQATVADAKRRAAGSAPSDF